MPVSDAIRRAALREFTAEHQATVLDGLARIRDQDGECVQAATLALTFGNRELFERWIVTAQAGARDIAYVLESPQLVDATLTWARGDAVV